MRRAPASSSLPGPSATGEYSFSANRRTSTPNFTRAGSTAVDLVKAVPVRLYNVYRAYLNIFRLTWWSRVFILLLLFQCAFWIFYSARCFVETRRSIEANEARLGCTDASVNKCYDPRLSDACAAAVLPPPARAAPARPCPRPRARPRLAGGRARSSAGRSSCSSSRRTRW